jgi:hypothetical protein
MSTDTQKYSDELEREPRHSALEEFSRDERRPAVMLLGALVIAVLFFALGIMVGRWTTRPTPALNTPPTNQPRGIAPVSTVTPAASPTPTPTPPRPATQPTRTR